jgi:vitamin B12 transporter
MDLVPGIEYEHKSAEFTNRGSYNSSVDAWEYNTAYFLNSNWRATDDLIISSGIRQDTLEDYDDYTTLRFGGAYIVNDKLTVRSNWSNSVRTPTLYEKYGADNYGYRGNSTLDVERGETLDLGFTLGALDVVYYTTDIDNAITYANSSYTNDNGTSTRQGVEANYTYALTDEWTHTIGSHWSDAQSSDRTQLLRRPMWTASQTLVKNTDSYTTTLVHNYTGDHIDLDSVTYARKDMSEINTVDLHHQVGPITASVRNMFDEQYEQPDGYKQSGRTFEISYKLKF